MSYSLRFFNFFSFSSEAQGQRWMLCRKDTNTLQLCTQTSAKNFVSCSCMSCHGIYTHFSLQCSSAKTTKAQTLNPKQPEILNP